MAGRVIVLGSVNADLVVTTDVLPVAGQTVVGSSFTRAQGGKGANQAVAAARAGAEVVLCGAVGSDAFGDAAVAELVDDGVDVSRVARVDDPTGVAVIVVESSGENSIVVVAGANSGARGAGVVWRPGDVASAVLEVPVSAVEEFFAEARAGGATTFLNAAPATAGAERLLGLCDVVCVNEVELAALGGSVDGWVGGAALVATLGAGGVRVVDDQGEMLLAAHEVSVVDTVGAGDATCGVLVAGLAAGLSLRDAAVRANAAGAMTVRAAGARTSPTFGELDDFLRSR